MFISKHLKLPVIDYRKLPGNLTDRNFEWNSGNISYELQFENVTAKIDFEKQGDIFRHMTVHFARKGIEYSASGTVENDGVRPYFHPVYCVIKRPYFHPVYTAVKPKVGVSDFFFDAKNLSKRQKDITGAIKSNTDFILSDLLNSSESAKEIKKAICETETPDRRMMDMFSESMKKLFSYQ